jgi:hypothetical protein
MIPFHVQKYVNNSLVLDLQFQSVSLKLPALPPCKSPRSKRLKETLRMIRPIRIFFSILLTILGGSSTDRRPTVLTARPIKD